MKKSLIVLLLIGLLLPMTMSAQSFDALWKQVEQARQKDLPKTQINLLDKIERKLLSLQLKTSISPDSLEVEINNLKERAKEAERKNEVLAAVYNCILGVLSKREDDGKADLYFRKALANPSLLARQRAADYQPLVSMGKDDSLFNGDLLHVIGMAAGDYTKLSRYYAGQGNREAACYTAMLAVDEDDEKAVARLDSLIQLYGDLPICGQVAVERYNAMNDDVPVKEKVAFIDKALVVLG